MNDSYQDLDALASVVICCMGDLGAANYNDRVIVQIVERLVPQYRALINLAEQHGEYIKAGYYSLHWEDRQ